MKTKSIGKIIFVIILSLSAICSDAQNNGYNNFSKEFQIVGGSPVSISSYNKLIIVNTWAENKIEVSTAILNTVADLNSTNWIKKTGIKINQSADTLKIIAGYSNDKVKENLYSILALKIPKGCKLIIDNKNSDIIIQNDINDLNIHMFSGHLQTKNIENLSLESDYIDFDAGDIKNARINFKHGNFRVSSIENLKITSEATNLFCTKLEKSDIQSTNDNYEIKEVGVMVCNKSFNTIHVDKLTASLDLTGAGADLEIGEIEPTTNFLKIHDKYSHLHLPLTDLKDYNVTFQGGFTKVFANFEKKPILNAPPIKDQNIVYTGVVIGGTTTPEKSDTAKSKPSKTSVTADKDPQSFTVKAGKGNMNINVDCYNCLVNFK